MRRVAAPVLLALAAVAGLSACGADPDDSATSPSSAALTPSLSTVTVTAPPATSEDAADVTDEPEPIDETGAAQNDAAQTGRQGSDACAFATQDSLMSALRATPEFDRVARPTGFRRIQCSAPFALANTSGTPQSSGVLFTRSGDGWSVLDVGSAIQCAQYGVTAAQAPALEGCVV